MSVYDLAMRYWKADKQWKLSLNGINNYFFTGITPISTTITEVDEEEFDADDFSFLFSARSSTSRYYFAERGIGDGYVYAMGWVDVTNSVVVSDGLRHTFRLDDGQIYVDDVSVASSGSTFNTIGYEMPIGAQNNAGVITDESDFIFYSATITYEGDVHRYVPDGDIEKIRHYMNDVEQTPITVQGTVLSSQWIEI